ARAGDHPSATAVASGLVRPTRRLGRAALERLRRRSRALLALLPVGFTEPPQSPGVLVVSYTAVSPLPPLPAAVCFLWHCPAGHPGWVLPTTVLFGVRTFLNGACTPPRSPGRLVRRDHKPSASARHSPSRSRSRSAFLLHLFRGRERGTGAGTR